MADTSGAFDARALFGYDCNGKSTSGYPTPSTVRVYDGDELVADIASWYVLTNGTKCVPPAYAAPVARAIAEEEERDERVGNEERVNGYYPQLADVELLGDPRDADFKTPITLRFSGDDAITIERDFDARDAFAGLWDYYAGDCCTGATGASADARAVSGALVQRATVSHMYYGDEAARLTVMQCVLPALRAYIEGHPDAIMTAWDLEELGYDWAKRLHEAALAARRDKCRPNLLALMREARAAAVTTPTGIASLDAIMGGGFANGVYVVAGDPGAGKTALAAQLLLWGAHICREDERVAYVMADQGGAAEVAKRLLSLSYAIAHDGDGAGGCELSRAASWGEDELAAAHEAYARISGERLALYSGSDVDAILRELRTLADDCVVRVRLLVVDYYQLLHGDWQDDDATVGTDPDFASHVMGRLRAWAYENKAAVLLVGQFTKEAIVRHAKGGDAAMTDLLGSVDVPYQAEDVLVVTNRHGGAGCRVEVRATKARHAGNMAQDGRVARLAFDGEHGLFIDQNAEG